MTNLNTITRLVQPATTQIGIIRGNYFYPLGCGVFVEYQNSLTLITAGHILGLANYADLLIPLPGTQEGLFIVHFGELVTSNQDPDQETEIDFAIIRFTTSHLEEKVKQYYSYIPYSSLLLNHELILDKSNYLAFGYPTSKSKFNYTTRGSVDTIPLKLITSPYENNSILINQNYDLEVINGLNIRKKIFFEKRLLTLPKTKGMSGCGIYFIPHLNCRHFSSEYYLIGILIEIDFSLRVLIFTKLKFILDQLNELN